MQILPLLLPTLSTLAAAGDIRQQCGSQNMAFTGDEHNPSFSYECTGLNGQDSSTISLNDCFAFNADEEKFEVKSGLVHSLVSTLALYIYLANKAHNTVAMPLLRLANSTPSEPMPRQGSLVLARARNTLVTSVCYAVAAPFSVCISST